MNESIFDFGNADYLTTSFPPAHDFQDIAHKKLRNGAAEGHKKQLIMSPTGSGKTYLGMRIMHESLIKNDSNRVLFACDRTTLINQTSDVADAYGLSAHGIMQADHWRTDKKQRMQIASVQTLARREWPKANVIVIDEAHCQYKSWTDYVKKTDAFVVGLSATPFAKGLGLIFSNLINAATMHDLTQIGILVPMKVYSCTRINMDGAETLGGEWSDSASASRGMEIIGDVVSEWQAYASDRKTIVFGATIAHCEALRDQFNAAGIRAEVFTCNTTVEEREVILTEYRKNDSLIRILISVEALAKGFDVPDVGCVADCRPLRKSLSTFMQMIGRGARSSKSTDKKDFILLDFSGNIIRFREDFEEIYHNGLDSLDMGEKLDKAIRQDGDEEKEPKGCPKCGSLPFFKKCMSCGYEHKSVNLIEHQAGIMQEIKIGNVKAANNKYELYQQCCALARQRGNPETQKQRAYYSYKSIAGSDPIWNFDKTPNAPITRAVMNKIMANAIAYSKRQGRAA